MRNTEDRRFSSSKSDTIGGAGGGPRPPEIGQKLGTVYSFSVARDNRKLYTVPNYSKTIHCPQLPVPCPQLPVPNYSNYSSPITRYRHARHAACVSSGVSSGSVPPHRRAAWSRPDHGCLAPCEPMPYRGRMLSRMKIICNNSPHRRRLALTGPSRIRVARRTAAG